MGKTVAISDDIHTVVSKKKTELFEKYRISIRISDIVDKAIAHGIEDACEEFVPKGEITKFELVKEEDMSK